MSAATPSGSSQSPAPMDTSPVNPDATSNLPPTDRVILEYLRARGHSSAAKVLLDELEGAFPSESGKPADTIAAEEFLKVINAFAQKPKAGESAPKDTVMQELSTLGNPANIQALIASLGGVATDDMLPNPNDKQEGFQELEAWVDGSLDMYRPEFRPILFPIFCHFYFDLIQEGHKDAANRFFATFSESLAPSHKNILHHLSTLLLPGHVQNDDLAQRFRNEKYTIRMSRSGFSLLLGWLTEGYGGEAMGAGEGFSGEKGRRGRAAVMRVVNNHLRFDVTSTNPTSVSPSAWEESTGLLSSLIPQTSGSKASLTNPQAFNTSKGALKLGPAPISEELRTEAERVLREQAMMDLNVNIQFDLHITRPAVAPGLIAPTEADLPPHPPTFKMADVEREVALVRDARKRIRLEPSVLANVDPNSPQASALRARALPSICAYTLHDVAEGAPCCSFSQDTSLMAAGFAESYVRLWSLNGEKLKGLRSDFSSGAIKDASSLNKIREKKGSSTRKLIGHSGPVYSVAFDPLNGSAAPPKYLLSASADATARLWSLDTLTNLVAFRGHENPIWDVKWSPLGVYFATASRDRTARLWSTERTSCLRVYAGHLSDVDCLQFHPNSLYLATGSSDWTARLWDVQRGSCLRVFIGHQGAVSSLALSPDGRYLATAGEDLAINLWDIGSGKRIKKMTGHTSSIYSLAFSAESSLLVSGGADWTVRTWDVKHAGGPRTKSPKNGTVNGSRSYGEEENAETSDLLATFPTKRTPITNVQFTSRNLCLVGGVYLAPESR
ncbi:TFIID and SAGA subunit [Pholiota conissans]|uniref:TFIID and SAGA subunit n=1 Tax=Pholiota conissans TaxID=109636 RepID=A0A9P5Z5H5_9AGAR|nr:TFIID and SAGA subunit [Pholiota conissans]